MSEPDQFELGRRRFQFLYESIFGEISSMLSKVKLMPLHSLCEEEPSLKKRAEDLIQLQSIMEEVAKLLNISYNKTQIDEYIDLAVRVGDAIDSECPETLGAAIAELDLKPYI
ncbi:hypothetical protein AKG94_01465 [Vibrio harveyi]|uniref:hypothetical protein n=1 Tax=Vibrio harveyi TaxID=669 RepID=UPI00069EC3CE|nr:hypothetical protein [Vibrio harveyi]ELH4834624.1 hypothetical protein [Vibrio harveyi]KNY48229.1 hypothetical protein AKG94_01465 [Vibrio harveyi]